MTSLVLAAVRDALAQAPRIVEGMIPGAPPDALAWREARGGWTPVEVLAHLADGGTSNWMPRIEQILQGGGQLEPFVREAGLARYRPWGAEALVGEFGQLRRANLEKLDRLALSAPHLRLTGEHDRNHLAQLEQLMTQRALGRAQPFSPAPAKPAVPPALLDQLDVRAGTIRAATPLPATDRLALLTVAFGDRDRTSSPAYEWNGNRWTG